MGNANRNVLEGAGFALLGASLLLSVGGDGSSAVRFALTGLGWFVLAIAGRTDTRFRRAARNVKYLIAATMGMALIAELFRISASLSDRQEVGIVIAMTVATFVVIPAYLLYSGWPAIRDFFALQHQPSKQMSSADRTEHPDNGTVQR